MPHQTPGEKRQNNKKCINYFFSSEKLSPCKNQQSNLNKIYYYEKISVYTDYYF
jgi:hypothetical protein